MVTDVLKQLHEASGLTLGKLTYIFGVSRVSLHKWLGGKPCTLAHKEHILEVSILIKEAAERKGSPQEVAIWLLTPVSSGGKKPIAYLAERQYDVFRGFLLRERTGHERFTRLAPSGRIYQERPREEVEAELERLRPGICLEDYEDEPYWAGSITIPSEVLQGLTDKGEKL